METKVVDYLITKKVKKVNNSFRKIFRQTDKEKAYPEYQRCTNPLATHFIPYQRRTKTAPRIFSSSTNAIHIPSNPQPRCIPNR